MSDVQALGALGALGPALRLVFAGVMYQGAHKWFDMHVHYKPPWCTI
jgi:hypothetical protein